MDWEEQIGVALRRYRIRGRINQAAIARVLGVSQSQVSRWESGRDRPRAHNLDAIKALVLGRDEPVLAALIEQVRTASGPLVLLDGNLRVVAAARSLRIAGGEMTRFGWIFDPRDNPALPLLARRLSVAAMRERSVLGAKVTLPFTHEACPWGAVVELALYRLGGEIFGLGEIAFEPDPEVRLVGTVALRRKGQGARVAAAQADQPAARPL